MQEKGRVNPFFPYLGRVIVQNQRKVWKCKGAISNMCKSLYRSSAERHFYGTENVIWAGFGPVGNTERKKRLGRF